MSESPPPDKLAHPCFPQPADIAIRVWRYLDLAKFVWLLENQKLYLSRLDFLNDPHEGSTPKLLAALRDQEFRQLGADQLVVDLPKINEQSRRSLYVSCWHLGDGESEAMWRLYCPGSNGVAIQTSYRKLATSVDYDPFLYIGRVTYIDYETQGFPLNNLFYPVMHKRLSFAHEQEVRVVKTLSEFWGPARPSPEGIEVPWSIEKTIEAIYVNPYAPEYYYDAVRSVVKRIAPNIEAHLRWSQMRAAPVY
jgi:hypothetical protein